jgi:hypothetical protein
MVGSFTWECLDVELLRTLPIEIHLTASTRVCEATPAVAAAAISFVFMSLTGSSCRHYPKWILRILHQGVINLMPSSADTFTTTYLIVL